MDNAENLIERHQTHKDHMLPDAVHMRRPEYVDLQGQWQVLSHVWLFVTPWTIWSMEFSRPEHWSG